jgi:hypothetical protein
MWYRVGQLGAENTGWEGWEWSVFIFGAPKVVAPTCVNWGLIIWPWWTRLIMYWHIWDLRGPTNLVASMVPELDDTPLYLTDVHWDIWGPPMDAHRGIAWKIYTRVRWTRLDSLIVMVNCGHLWCLRGSRVSWCQVISLVKCILIQISMTPSVMGDACSLLSFHRSANSPMFIWELWLC